MKVTDLRRKLLAALAASGMLTPGAVYAANFNQNVVVNGDFENVDLATTNLLHSPRILNWTSVIGGYAYSHNGSSSSAGQVPDFANGTDPPNAGNWYFTSNRPDGGPAADRIDTPGEFYQDVDVSNSEASGIIRSGGAVFNLSAYMSTYANDKDLAKIHLDFRNSLGTSLGTSLMTDNDLTDPSVPILNNWNLNTLTGNIPAGTTTVRVSAFGTKHLPSDPGDGADGYIDNVDLRLNVPTLAILVNKANGNIMLKNLTGGSVNMSAYSITSAFEAMSTTGWLPIADNYDSGNPGPNQVDSAHAWSKLTAAGAHTDLSEADLQAGTGAAIANDGVINLGNSDWIQNPREDLVFQYISGGQIKTGVVAYLGNNNLTYAMGDFNVDGVINSSDWAILRSNQLSNLSSFSLAQAYRLGDLTGDKVNDHADFVAFKSLYDSAHGSGSFATMLAAGEVPEPSCLLLVFGAGTIFWPVVRRRSNR